MLHVNINYAISINLIQTFFSYSKLNFFCKQILLGVNGFNIPILDIFDQSD